MIWNSAQEVCCLSHWFIQSFIYISISPWIFILLGCDPILLYCVACFSFSQWEVSRWLLCPSEDPPHVPVCVKHFFILYTLCSFCPSSRIGCFSKKPWFLLWENGVRNQGLGGRCRLLVSAKKKKIQDNAQQGVPSFYEPNPQIYWHCLWPLALAETEIHTVWDWTPVMPPPIC